MSELVLELIAHTNDLYGQQKQLVLPLVNHVHKRVERFIYTKAVRDESVPLVFLENEPLDAWDNIQIANRTYAIAVNGRRNIEHRRGLIKVEATSFTSVYKDVAVTNKTFVDENGRVAPLFWRHNLPGDVVSCEMQQISYGNKIDITTGFELNLDTSSIYTNYRNFFDPDTGAYKLYFVVCVDTAGVITHQLLNPVPIAKEATWEDIDLITGKLTEDYPVYSKEKSGSGYTFFFNASDTWYVKPLSKSLIQPLRPAGKSPDDPWYIRFTNGDFSALVNGRVRKYSLPEFDQQPFVPYKPLRYSPYSKMLRVNGNILAATKDGLKISPDNGLHFSLFAYDVEGLLIRAFSTDVSLEATRFADTGVFWETDKIQSWDNEEGFVALGVQLHASWSFEAQYYYESQEYEYTLLNLNPLSNKRVSGRTYVFYLVPGVDFEDRALHYIEIEQDSKIIYCSQGEGLAHANLQLYNLDGSYNSNTVIGLRYISDIETDTFLTRHTAGYDNDNGYAILAEVVLLDRSLVENQEIIDVRRLGDSLTTSAFDSAVRRNPKLLQSVYGYGEDGMESPENAVMVIKAPVDLLTTYGGDLEEDTAEQDLRKYLPGAVLSAVEWTWPQSDLSGTSIRLSQVDLTWTWEGPNLDYRLYRKDTPTAEWVLVTTVSSPAEADITYTDVTVESGKIYYYETRIHNGSYEYPPGHSLGIKVL